VLSSRFKVLAACGDAIREFVGRNLALVTFLSTYLLTTVLGNFVYPFPIGRRIAGVTLNGFDLSHFSSASTFGYWCLLLMPFIVTPVAAVATRASLSQRIGHLSRGLVDFQPSHYLIGLSICYGYVVFAFWHTGGFLLSFRGGTPDESVMYRFQILEGLGFWPQMVLKSLLMFLSTYSFVKALRASGTFWTSIAIFNLGTMSFLLLSLNMKWPILLLYVAAALCLFMFSRRLPYLAIAVCVPAIVIAYLLVGLVVTRWMPTSNNAGPPGSVSALLMGAMNRMAISYPFYYETFSKEGQICGTIVDRIMRNNNPCHPSNLIFNRMTGEGGLGGKGTEPAAVHISGYALGGWIGALVELALASIVIGTFVALPYPLAGNAMTQTLSVMGALTGYYFSQLPVEAAFVYDHGILWWLALVATYSFFMYFATGQSRSTGN
jgi:hypothetical protein